MREKLILLLIGSLISISLSVGAFFVSSFFGSYVSKADYNKDRSLIDVSLGIIKNNQEEMKNTQKEMRDELKTIFHKTMKD